ncbi:MAG: SCO family protein [Flavobacterium sp.]|nr:SCO family protein [Flavobacterium sp.]
MKNKSYIGISFVILLFGIWAVPKIVDRFSNKQVIEDDRLNNAGTATGKSNDLLLIAKAPEFSLTNQDGKTITNNDYLGKVYVLEFFFTACPTICPVMNQNMLTIQNEFFGNKNFGIASITIDPKQDTPEVLKKHAEELGVKSANWNFLTGDKDSIYAVANKGFNLYVGQNSQASGGFEHSGMFALVDKKGNIRCRSDELGNPIMYYDGIEAVGIKAIMTDIKILLNE